MCMYTHIHLMALGTCVLTIREIAVARNIDH